MEISYIPQRIEQFDGIVIPATNLCSGIDKAFLRRMKCVIRYQSSDAEMRHDIRTACRPNCRTRNSTPDYLAGQFDLTDGTIKNVIYTACALAIHDNQKLCMEHVLNAVRAEYEKMERTLWGSHRLVDAMPLLPRRGIEISQRSYHRFYNRLIADLYFLYTNYFLPSHEPPALLVVCCWPY